MCVFAELLFLCVCVCVTEVEPVADVFMYVRWHIYVW